MTQTEQVSFPTPDTGYVLPPGTTVLQVLPNLISGGVEQGVVDLNAGLVKAGMKSIVVSNGGPRVYDINKAGGVHIELPVHSKNPFTIWLNARRLRRVIREHKVDIVHAASRAPAWSAARAVEGTSARFVTSCHAAHKISNGFKKAYNRAIIGGECVIAVSQFLGRYLNDSYGLARDKIRIIHRGVSLERFHPTRVSADRLIAVSNQMRMPEGVSVIMLPGRLSRGKGHMVLLQALQKLNRSDLFCLFVGSDAGQEGYRRELESAISSAGLQQQCRIVTDCNDIPAAYMLATVVVCPSLVAEGFGRIAIEAQAMGRPVIASSHGGLAETLVDGSTGWLVKAGDAAALAEGIDKALQLSDEERAALATRAMSHVASYFTNTTMCQQTMAVYAEVLAAAKAGQAKAA